MSVERRRAWVVRDDSQLSVSKQCRLLQISRGGLYYEQKGESDFNLELMRGIDEQYLDTPWYGSRQMARGFVYLVAIMDWHTRRVLSWRLSITQDRHCCLEALQEALEHYGCPEILNSDQGSQFTSREWTGNVRTRHWMD